MTTVYSLNGFQTTYDDRVSDNSNGQIEDPVVDFTQSSITFEFPSDVTSVRYTPGLFTDAPNGVSDDDPDIFIELLPDPIRVAIDGTNVNLLHNPLGSLFEFLEVTWDQGTSYFFGYLYDDVYTGSFFDNAFRYEYLFFAGGEPIPELNTFEDLVLFQNRVSSQPTTPSGPFAPDTDIPLSAFAWESITVTPQDTGPTPEADTLTGDNTAEALDGLGGNDTINAGGGDDTVTGGAGHDVLNGGPGIDTAAFANEQARYTLTLTDGNITITDRSSDGTGTDTLQNFEFLYFEVSDGVPFELDRFDGATGVSAEDFAAITELYIAYFNRAPDALGLNFWATAFSEGVNLTNMAAFFFDQPETRATYADVLDATGTQITDVTSFVTQVYANVLGRAFDQAGLDFWVGALESGGVTPAGFISDIIAGAKAPAPGDADQAFIDQKAADVAYLSTKTDIGAYFAVINGLSDLEDARQVMTLFDGTDDGIAAAIAATDAAYQDALDPVNGDFLMPLVGVLENPFE